VGNYYWIGGYTANVGQGSGWSGDWHGSGVAVWTSPFNGLTSQNGDLHFGPYFWDFKQNWLELVTATGTGLPTMSNATRPPKNGDNVVIDWLSVSGHTPYSIALLWGGVSGASGFWSGTTSANPLASFVVGNSYGNSYYDSGGGATSHINHAVGAVGSGIYTKNTSPAITGYRGLYTRQIGFKYEIGFPDSTPLGTNFIGQYEPLDLRTYSVDFNPQFADAYINLQGSHTTYVSTPPSQNTTARRKFLYLMGTVQVIDQRSGYIGNLSLSGNSLTVDRWYLQGTSTATLNRNCVVNTSVECYPSSTQMHQLPNIESEITIQCAVPTLVTESGLTNAAETGMTAVTYYIGNRDGTATPTIGSWRINSGAGGKKPYIKMGSFICDNLDAQNCYMKPYTYDANQPLMPNTYPVFRDGRLGMNATLDCYANHSDSWSNVLIGYSPSDEGLRIDDDTALIKFHIGDNVKINGKEFPLGVTS
jgi:hypothetical protein